MIVTDSPAIVLAELVVVAVVEASGTTAIAPVDEYDNDEDVTGRAELVDDEDDDDEEEAEEEAVVIVADSVMTASTTWLADEEDEKEEEEETVLAAADEDEDEFKDSEEDENAAFPAFRPELVAAASVTGTDASVACP